MRILVIGATGGTGLEVVAEALRRRVDVTAIVRSPEKLGGLAERIRVLHASAFDPDAIADGASDAGAAISTIGAPSGFLGRGATTVYSHAAEALSSGLPRAGVRRLLFCTSAGVEPHDPSEALPYRLIAKPLFLQRAYDDMIRAESVIRASGLEWTLVRPGRLTDGGASGAIHVSPHLRTPGGHGISRADVALFLLDQIDEPRWVRGTPTLTG